MIHDPTNEHCRSHACTSLELILQLRTPSPKKYALCTQHAARGLQYRLYSIYTKQSTGKPFASRVTPLASL